MNKVLLIKIEAPTYSSIGMEEAFREHFKEVYSIDWQHERFNHGLAGMWDKIITTCEKVKPDLIFCQIQRKDVLTVAQFKKLAQYGFVINYTEDVREDISFYEEVGEFIGLTIFTNKVDAAIFKHSNVAYMFVSYNHLWYKPQAKTEKYYGDIVFIGNNYVGTNLKFPEAQERQDMISFLKGKFGDKFRAYGMGQEFPMLLPYQVVEAYNNCKVVVTQNNFKRDGYCSDRGLNAMGCGAKTVNQYFEGINNMFPFLAIDCWFDFEGLYTTCEILLKENDNPHKEENSKWMKENHSWLNRVKVVMSFIKLLKPETIFREQAIEYADEVYELNVPCIPEHKIRGIVPTILEIKYDGQVCDCGRIKFKSEDCGCSGNPHKELKQYPNE